MSTPKNEIIPKNYVTPVNKSLLTPCRRIGLSRTKKTPKNDVTISSNNTKTTPKTIEVKASDVKKKLCLEKLKDAPVKVDTVSVKRNILASNINKTSVKGPIDCNNLEDDVCNSQSKNIRKKPRNTKMNDKSEKMDNLNAQTIKVQADVHVSENSENTNETKGSIKPDGPLNATQKRKLILDSEESNIILKELNQINVQESNITQDKYIKVKEESDEIIITKTKKRKFVLDSEDSQTVVKTMNENKSSNVNKIENQVKTDSTSLSRFTTQEYLEDYSKNPAKFEIEQLSKSDEHEPSTSTTEHVVDNLIVLSGSTLDKLINISVSETQNLRPVEKDPSINLSKKMTVSLDKLTEEQINQMTHQDVNILKQLKDKPVPAKIKLSYDLDDEDFTSSPETEKRQRKNLINLIANLETEIKKKEQKLEKLKQAQVYKNKHSPEQLGVSTAAWLDGCREGLKDLLVKMREHGPMEMESLIRKLRIPDEIVKKLGI